MYQISINRKAKKFIDKLIPDDRRRIVSAIMKLPSGDTKKLKGHENLYRLRVGEYRIIYTKNDTELIICVINAGNRGQIYNRY